MRWSKEVYVLRVVTRGDVGQKNNTLRRCYSLHVLQRTSCDCNSRVVLVYCLEAVSLAEVHLSRLTVGRPGRNRGEGQLGQAASEQWAFARDSSQS